MKTLIQSKVDLITIVLCVLMLVVTVSAIGPVQRELAFREICKENLSHLARAMLIYANDFDDELPKAGGRVNEWVQELPNWQASTRQEAYDVNGLHYRYGKATVSASLYLLVKYGEVTPQQLICRGDVLSKVFSLDDVPEVSEGLSLIDAWDFGPWIDNNNNPSRYCSYAYHHPFDAYALTTSSDPAMAILADRNPWLTSERLNQSDSATWDNFIPDDDQWDGSSETGMIGNSESHQGDGQNVLFVDAHVSFEQRAFCALESDNIYTLGENIHNVLSTRGLRPTFENQSPADREDSMLIQNPEAEIQP